MDYIPTDYGIEVWTNEKNRNPDHLAGTIFIDKGKMFFETGHDSAQLSKDNLMEIISNME